MGKKRLGHYCWCCNRRLSNERFTGRGHAQHLCGECRRLPTGEREFRQAVRDIDRLVHEGEGGLRIKEKRRREFESFAHHNDDRIRNYARSIRERVEADSQATAASWEQVCRAEDDHARLRELLNLDRDLADSLGWGLKAGEENPF